VNSVTPWSRGLDEQTLEFGREDVIRCWRTPEKHVSRKHFTLELAASDGEAVLTCTGSNPMRQSGASEDTVLEKGESLRAGAGSCLKLARGTTKGTSSWYWLELRVCDPGL